MGFVGALHSLRSFRRRLPWALGLTITPMARVPIPNAIQQIAHAPDRALAWEFFVFFSRFEYALKRDRRFLQPGTGDAQPNWDRFASDHNHNFNPATSQALQDAVAFYLAHPPRKQLRNHGEMSWSEPQTWDGREPQLIWLLRVVRTVRNNLFHGGKFPLLPVHEVSRDRNLIMHGLVILDGALSLDRVVQHNFLDGLE